MRNAGSPAPPPMERSDNRPQDIDTIWQMAEVDEELKKSIDEMRGDPLGYFSAKVLEFSHRDEPMKCDDATRIVQLCSLALQSLMCPGGVKGAESLDGSSSTQLQTVITQCISAAQPFMKGSLLLAELCSWQIASFACAIQRMQQRPPSEVVSLDWNTLGDDFSPLLRGVVTAPPSLAPISVIGDRPPKPIRKRTVKKSLQDLPDSSPDRGIVKDSTQEAQESSRIQVKRQSMLLQAIRDRFMRTGMPLPLFATLCDPSSWSKTVEHFFDLSIEQTNSTLVTFGSRSLEDRRSWCQAHLPWPDDLEPEFMFVIPVLSEAEVADLVEPGSSRPPTSNNDDRPSSPRGRSRRGNKEQDLAESSTTAAMPFNFVFQWTDDKYQRVCMKLSPIHASMPLCASSGD